MRAHSHRQLIFALIGLLVGSTPAAAMECGFHGYKATVTRVIDGDTVAANVTLGFGIRATEQRIRLAGIDAPEVRGDRAGAGAAARSALRHRVEGRQVVICTLPDRNGDARRDGFGRTLAILWHLQPNGYARNLNVWMVLAGHAEPSWEPLMLRDLLPGS